MPTESTSSHEWLAWVAGIFITLLTGAFGFVFRFAQSAHEKLDEVTDEMHGRINGAKQETVEVSGRTGRLEERMKDVERRMEQAERETAKVGAIAATLEAIKDQLGRIERKLSET